MTAQTCERCGRGIGFDDGQCAAECTFDPAFLEECSDYVKRTLSEKVARLERENAELRAALDGVMGVVHEECHEAPFPRGHERGGAACNGCTAVQTARDLLARCRKVEA